MILDPNEINTLNFDEKFNELVEHGTSTYKFLLKVLDNDLNEYQFDRLRSYIIDRFINEEFECAEWEDRFNLLEEVKERYIEDMQFLEHCKNFNITDEQRCIINTDHGDIKTLVIPIDMFNDTNLSPFEIIVYNLKYIWDKTYAEIARMLNRDPSTIETVFKRAFIKLEGDCQYVTDGDTGKEMK